jgi:hypothetical protein
MTRALRIVFPDAWYHMMNRRVDGSLRGALADRKADIEARADLMTFLPKQGKESRIGNKLRPD